MKRMKLISGIIAAAMAVTSMSAVTAFAADVAVKVGTDTKNPGEEFSVTVDLSGVPSSGLSTIDFAISYDASLIDITGVTLGSIGSTGAAAQEGSDLGDTVFNWYKNDGEIEIVWATGLTDSSYWVSKDGTLATISGTVKSDAAKGSKADLKVKAVGREAYPGGSANADILFTAIGESSTTDYTAAPTNGYVQIGGGTVNPTVTYGDVDCNGDVNVADAVLLARLEAEDKEVTVTAQGKLNADCSNDGKGALTAEDLNALLSYLAGIYKYDQLPIAE